MYHYTAETTVSVEQAVAALEAALREEQFGVLWRLNLHEKLMEKGIEFDGEYTILEVCNPAIAHKAVNHNRMAGYFMPCKIVVYEAGGKTKIGMPKPTVLMNLPGDDALKDLAAGVEQRLIGCIDRVAHS